MKSFSLKLSVAAVALLGIASTSVAMAEDDPYGTFSGSVAVATDYRWRGLTQNAKEATPELGINWAGPEGFYAGTWYAKTNWGNNNPSFEADWFIGKHTDLAGTDLNTEIYYYSYPDYHTNGGKAGSFVEGIVQLTHAFGPVTVTGTGAFSPEWSAVGGTAAYGSATVAYTLTDWLSLSSNVGYQWADKVVDYKGKSGANYVHYDIGATATWKAFSLDVRYVDTTLSKAQATSWTAIDKGAAGGFTALITYNIAKLF